MHPNCFIQGFFKPHFMEIAQAAASTSDEKLLFSKKACLPFHLIVMSHFKESARLGQHCPVSIYSEFKGRVSRAASSNPPVYVLFMRTCVWFFTRWNYFSHSRDCIQRPAEVFIPRKRFPHFVVLHHKPQRIFLFYFMRQTNTVSYKNGSKTITCFQHFLLIKSDKCGILISSLPESHTLL